MFFILAFVMISWESLFVEKGHKLVMLIVLEIEFGELYKFNVIIKIEQHISFPPTSKT